MLVVEELTESGTLRISRWIFNCYVLLQADGAIVVDAGLPRLVDDLYPILQQRQLRVKAIVATHGHSDHLGGVYGLAERYGDCPVYIPARTLHYIHGQDEPRTPSFRSTLTIWNTLRDQPFDWKALWGLLRGSYIAGFGPTSPMRWKGAAPKGVLIDGGLIPGTSDWIVVPSPGHTDDSISFWNAGSRTLLCGDSILTANGRAHFTHELVDVVTAKATQARLTKLPVKHLLPGHGRPIHGDVWLRCDMYDQGRAWAID